MNKSQKIVAKLIIIDPDGYYLMMWRSNHPTFGDDPDLPGGTMEEGETPIRAMMREVMEESGVSVDAAKVDLLYDGEKYSDNNTRYVLYGTVLSKRPEIEISWEHSTYEWQTRDTFLATARAANDTYMHMAADTLKAS